MTLFKKLELKLKLKLLICEYNKTRLVKDKSSFCYAPSKSLRFSVNGNAFACCYNRMFSLGKYPNNTISEIWLGKNKLFLEKSFKKNNLLTSGCHSCYSSLISKSFYLVGARNYDLNDRNINPQYPEIIDFELDNNCNLKCIMCNGENSSTIRTEIENKPNFQLYYDEKFVKQLEEFIPHLREARFSGGEPFLSKIYFEIWNRIIEINPDCKIYIQTNGTVFNDRVLDIFIRGNINISFSIDSIIEETYQEIRRGSNFNLVIKNFRKIHELSAKYNREIGVSFCLLKQNINEIIDYIEYFNRYNVKITVHKVVFPLQHSIASLPIKQLEEILFKFISWEPNIKTLTEKFNQSTFNSVISFIESLITQKKERTTIDELFPVLNQIDLIWLNIEKKLYEIKQTGQINNIKIKYIDLCDKISQMKNYNECIELLSQVPPIFLISELITNEPDRIFSRVFINE